MASKDFGSLGIRPLSYSQSFSHHQKSGWSTQEQAAVISEQLLHANAWCLYLEYQDIYPQEALKGFKVAIQVASIQESLLMLQKLDLARGMEAHHSEQKKHLCQDLCSPSPKHSNEDQMPQEGMLSG